MNIMLAHELDEAYPMAVSGKKDSEVDDEEVDDKIVPQGISPTKLVGVLTKAVQELKAENDALKAQMAAVLARLDLLEA